MSNLDHTFYIDANGNSEQRLRYLNCYERAVYFYYRNKYLLKYDAFHLFIYNYLPVVEISNDKIIDILGNPPSKTIPCNVELSYISKNLSDMIDLVKKGEYVAFKTSDADVPFSNVYKKYDADESDFGDYYLVIETTDDYFYLPLYLHNDYERLYHYNKNISYVHWNDMKEAFDKQIEIYRFVHNGLTEKPVNEIHHELFNDLFQSYSLSEKKSDSILYYGTACIDVLLDHFANESLNLNDTVGGKTLYRKLKACILQTIGKRQVLKECLETTCKTKYEGIIHKIISVINAYITLISVLEVEYMKKNMVLGKRYIKSLEEIRWSENEMKHALCDYV